MEDPTPETDQREQHLQTACLLFLSLLTAGLTLWLLRPVLVPFVLALFFVIGLSPLLDYIQRRLKATRPAAIGVSFLLGVLLTIAFGMLLARSIAVIGENRAAYEASIEDTIVWGADWLRGIGIDPFAPDTEAEPLPAEGLPAKSAEDVRHDQVVSKVTALATSQVQTAFLWLSSAMLDLLISLGVVLIFVFFLLAGASSEVRPTAGLWVEIENKIRGYIVTKTVISFFTGLAFGVVLALFGVPFSLSLLLGVLAFLLNFVPNVGPVIASALPIPIVLFMMPAREVVLEGGREVLVGYSVWWKTLALLAGAAVQVVSGNVVEPKIMGDSFELHPIVILLSLILWGMIWGPVGVLLAVPMTAAVKILLEKLDRTRPVAALLAGRLEPLEEVLDRQGGVA